MVSKIQSLFRGRQLRKKWEQGLHRKIDEFVHSQNSKYYRIRVDLNDRLLIFKGTNVSTRRPILYFSRKLFIKEVEEIDRIYGELKKKLNIVNECITLSG
jgi:hypothetical protein